MEYLFVWVGFSVMVGILATVNGRVGFGYFALSLLLSPLLVGILVLAIGKRAETTATHSRCPQCREVVRRDARKCKHCTSTLTPS